jgi:hypothetical protein
MKLHELGAQRPTEQLAHLIESHAGLSVDFSALGPRRAQGMLQKVQSLLKEQRGRPDFHRSEQDESYLRLMMMEQALSARLKEQNITPTGTTGTIGGAAARDPKAKMVMDKVARGQTLTPDEQKTANQIALMKEQSRSMVREQSEIQQAQVVLAAQDMIDRIQGMLEDISEMQFKDLPALANSIKNDMGTEQATQFQSSASAALTQLLTAVQAGKTELEGAQGVLTGQAPMVPGADQAAELPGVEPGADLGADDMEGELDLDANLDIQGDDEEEEIGAALGRERR